MGPSVRAVRLTGRTPSMSAVTEAERGVAALGMAIVVGINVLRPAATLQDIVGALAWGVLYFAAASLSGAMGAQYRVFQRRTESAYASIATITAATSYPELARMLFAYAER